MNEDGGGGVLQLTWKADAMSWQDAYQVSYAEVLTGSLSSSSSASDSLIVSSVLSLGNNLNQSLNGSSRQQSTSSAVASAAITATTSTDSNVLVVQATRESIEDPSTPIECTLESLLPGRNYSISVKSLSSGVASNDTVVYHTMSKLNNILYFCISFKLLNSLFEIVLLIFIYFLFIYRTFSTNY